MTDEKKLKKEEIINEELTDEQANEVAGGFFIDKEARYCTKCGCYLGTCRGNDYQHSGLSFYRVYNGKLYCIECYNNIKK